MLKTLLLAFGGVATLAVTAIISPPPRLVWNASASVPIGFYGITPLQRPAIDSIVLVEPPARFARLFDARGYVPFGVPLLKRIAALPGQRVCRQGPALSIDGKVVALALERDRRGRTLPIWNGCHTLRPGEVFLLNRDAPRSLDGRYFGLTATTSVIGQASPLWTREATR